MKKAFTNTIHKNTGPMTAATSKSSSMPKCTYGSACTRKGCVYKHPPKKSRPSASAEPSSSAAAAAAATPSQVCRPFLGGACTFGSRCRSRHPPFAEAEAMRASFKGTKCLHNEGCRSESCLYFHDWEREGEEREEVERVARELERVSLAKVEVERVPPARTALLPAVTFEEWVAGGCETADQSVWFDPNTGSQRIPEEVYEQLHPSSCPPPPVSRPPTGWAGIAATPASLPPPAAATVAAPLSLPPPPFRSVKIPPHLWNLSPPPPAAFHLPPPDRYFSVNSLHSLPLPPTLTSGTAGIVDLHFQSLSTFSPLLSFHLPSQLSVHTEAWIITGSGHHVAEGHQKAGGVLNEAVREWLEEWTAREGGRERVRRGVDGGGKGGCFLVTR